ncbi:MAG: hypothetical protein E7B79_09690, partial [Staphylococcus warneri]|nr:hypothetical protein [Staphylococcus warneri]
TTRYAGARRRLYLKNSKRDTIKGIKPVHFTTFFILFFGILLQKKNTTFCCILNIKSSPEFS